MKSNLILFLIFILLLSTTSCSRKSNETGYEIFPDMVHSAAYEAFSENTVTPDGKTMMLPPKNTIARGRMPFPYAKGSDEAKRAGRELVNPFPETAATLARGREVYTNYCMVCHGPKGKGDGPIIPKFPNPPSFTSKRLRKYPIGRVFHIINLGSGDMPSHMEQIDYKDRWFLAQYVKHMQVVFLNKKK